MILKWIFLGSLIYFFLVFIIPFLIFPGFLRSSGIKVTEKTKKLAKKLKARNKEKTFKNVFDYTQKKYTKEKHKAISELNKHFYKNVEEVLDKKQYLPCHVQNHVLVNLLIASGQFKKEDFKKRFTISRRFLCIHEYYLIQVDKKIFKADPFCGKLKEISNQN